MDLKIASKVGDDVVFKLSGKVSGIQDLVQRVMIELLSDFSPILSRGAGLKSLIEQSAIGDEDEVRRNIRTSVSAAKANILGCQQSSSNLSAEELLDDLRILSITIDESSTWFVELQVISKSGESVQTTLSA
jgi:hypothetical protein